MKICLFLTYVFSKKKSNLPDIVIQQYMQRRYQKYGMNIFKYYIVSNTNDNNQRDNCGNIVSIE